MLYQLLKRSTICCDTLISKSIFTSAKTNILFNHFVLMNSSFWLSIKLILRSQNWIWYNFLSFYQMRKSLKLSLYRCITCSIRLQIFFQYLRSKSRIFIELFSITCSKIVMLLLFMRLWAIMIFMQLCCKTIKWLLWSSSHLFRYSRDTDVWIILIILFFEYILNSCTSTILIMFRIIIAMYANK